MNPKSELNPKQPGIAVYVQSAAPPIHSTIQAKGGSTFFSFVFHVYPNLSIKPADRGRAVNIEIDPKSNL